MAAKNKESSRGMIGALLAIAAAALIAAGCSLPRSFPSASGNNGLSADSPPLPEVITHAVLFAHKSIAPKSTLIFNLPAEVNSSAWQTYERMLAPGKPMCPTDRAVYTVRQARIDGSLAQVDIEYPARDGFYQLVTVHMKDASAGIGYRPEYLQYWRIPVNDPVCHTPQAVLDRICPGAKAVVPASATTLTPTTSTANAPTASKPSTAATSSGAAKTEEPNK